MNPAIVTIRIFHKNPRFVSGMQHFLQRFRNKITKYPDSF